ncbi:hypothetical protein ACPCK3_15075 [Streptomyces griseoincarnatus]
MSLTVHDAAGRPVTAGDTIGGTTSGNHPTTLVGPVIRVNLDRVKVRVTNRPVCEGHRPGNGDEIWITARRIFRLHHAAERTWKGFRSPEGRVWTLAARTHKPLYESPMVQARYDAYTLRSMYDGRIEPVWEDGPAAPTPGEIRAGAFQEAAGRIADLPQDYELDPGRGDAIQLLNGLAAEAHRPDVYPPALPWARLMDPEDLVAFLRDLDDTLHRAATSVAVDAITDLTKASPAAVLDALESTCRSWRVTAEAQHAHHFAPGPNA